MSMCISPTSKIPCLLLLTFIFLTACSAKTTAPSPLLIADSQRLSASVEQAYWWHSDIHVHWPMGENPDWAVDAMLANEVFAPIVMNQSSAPLLWRFHRRAMRDASGQNFSFIFYASSDRAKEILRKIDADETLKQLSSVGIVERVNSGSFAAAPLPQIEGTSAPGWPPSLQRAWPYFIMGASATWLDLIRQEAQTAELDRRDVRTTLEGYRRVSKNIDAIWYEYAQRAFFHHLSAMFAYPEFQMKTELVF
ncbi:MAG: hypothetical protein J0M12_12215 [Deltaproteobacteria bacterium]|nr:hypothetical protein [Deltaproteobacteria bacterium]